jgi:hyperosmotically inducible protein
MITRQRIVTVLTTTAIAYSICSPTQAAGLVGAVRPQAREPVSDDVDRTLQNAIRVALRTDPLLDGIDVAVSANGGDVMLTGSVRDAVQLARVLQTALSVAGVRRIDNALAVAVERPGDSA